MGMIQIDMPMPKYCADCCFAIADLVNGIVTLFCMTPAGRQMYAPVLIDGKDRPEWCPLKEQNSCENCAVAIEDRVMVVRCKDCKHLQYTDGKIAFCHLSDLGHDYDWFCADGERRDNEK